MKAATPRIFWSAALTTLVAEVASVAIFMLERTIIGAPFDELDLLETVLIPIVVDFRSLSSFSASPSDCAVPMTN